MDLVKGSRSKIPILQGELWLKTRKLLAAGRMSSALFGYTLGIYKLPIVYDSDDIVTSETGQMLYKNDITWCERFKIHSVADLKDRIISDPLYNELWIGRCNKSYNLLTQTTELQRNKWQSMFLDLYLYGANEDLSLLFFENQQGVSFDVPTPV